MNIKPEIEVLTPLGHLDFLIKDNIIIEVNGPIHYRGDREDIKT